MKNYTESRHKDKRQFSRLESKLQVSLFYGNLVYTGIATNLSESGMFISTKRQFPLNSMLVTSLMINDEPIQLPVQITRAVEQLNEHDTAEIGVGVHVLRSSRDYLNFISKYRSEQLKLTL